MGYVSQKLIDEVIYKTDIVDVISKLITLQKQGSSYVAVCPFHNDSNPSLHVNPSKKIYKCFVCGNGGNVITFIQEFKGISFYEALKFLVNESGIVTNELNSISEKNKYSNQELRLFELNLAASNFFKVMLNSKIGVEAKKYLIKRGFDESEIKKWNVGYSFKDGGLIDNLLANGFSKTEIIDSGLATLKETKLYEYFINRIIFPIRNIDGHIVGFSGRKIIDVKDDKSPKYLNTRETLIFKKSHILFNIDSAKKYIKISKGLIILEGFMDVIALEKIGINNSVALMGTNLSDFHTDLIRTLTNDIKLFLDGDDPGVTAALKISKKFLGLKFKINIVNNNSEYDPDELVRSNKKDIVKKIINEAEHPVDFAINYFTNHLNLRDLNDQQKYIEEIVQLLRYVNDDLIINSTVNRISDQLKVDAALILKKINANTLNSKKPLKKEYEQEPYQLNTNISTSVRKKPSQFYRRAEDDIIWNLINDSKYIEVVEKHEDNLITPFKIFIVKKIIENYKKNNYSSQNFDYLMDTIGEYDKQYEEYLQQLKNDPLIKKYSTERGVLDAVGRLEEFALKAEREKINKDFINATDEQKQKYFFKRLVNKDKELRNIKKKHEDEKNGN